MKELTGEDIYPELKKDTVATDVKCGKAPAMPASLIQEERLQKDIAAIDDRLRTLEARAVTQGAQASGLEQVRYLQAKERALSIMNRMAGQGAGVRYGDEEMDAVKKRQGDLKKELDFFQGKSKPPAKLSDDIRNTDFDIKTQEDLMAAKKKEVALINSRYDDDKKRYGELTKGGSK